MRWTSWSEFWAMGGYALYVWGSFAVTALLMALEVWQARRQRDETLRWLRREHDLQAGDVARAFSAPSKDLP
jgi:heme exporter protein D